MTNGRNDAIARKPVETRPTELAGWLWRLFGGPGVIEQVVTRMHFDASLQNSWDEMMFYEEVPGRPPLLLRAIIPYPVRTEGTKSAVGSLVRCVYRGGDLVKRITAIDAPLAIRFDVLNQRLGIERCTVALNGSYELDESADGTEVAATTRYRTYLHPRWLWRPLEKIVTGQLHRHVLHGMRAAAEHRLPEMEVCASNVNRADG